MTGGAETGVVVEVGCGVGGAGVNGPEGTGEAGLGRNGVPMHTRKTAGSAAVAAELVKSAGAVMSGFTAVHFGAKSDADVSYLPAREQSP